MKYLINTLFVALLLSSTGLFAQQVNMRIVENGNNQCDGNTMCTTIQLNFSGPIQTIGSASIRFGYDHEVLKFNGDYTSLYFDEKTSCQSGSNESFPYHPHSFDGNLPGDFLLTIFYQNSFAAPVCLPADNVWQSVAEVCFDVLNTDGDPGIHIKGTQNGKVSDLSGTNFHTPSNEPSEKPNNGTFTDFNNSFNEVCNKTETAIEEIITDWEIQVSPNPATDFTIIDNPSAEKLQVEIYSIKGQLLRSLNENNSSQIKIDLKGLTNGVYLLKISNGASSKSERLVIQG